MDTIQSYIKLSKITTGFVYNVNEIVSIRLLQHANHAQVNYKNIEYQISRNQYLNLFKSLSSLYTIKHNVSSHQQFELMIINNQNHKLFWSNTYAGPTGCIVEGYKIKSQTTSKDNQLFDLSLNILYQFLNHL